MEKVKELRERLEKKLEELEKVEGADRSERAIEETKAFLALSDEELINKIEENYKEKQDSNKEMSEEELDNVAGGFEVIDGEIIDAVKQGFSNMWDFCFDKYKKVTPAKYCCPKCGTRDVDNIDIGFMYEMRVICHRCGFRGCKDGGSW